jgi:chromosome segregation ATPase
MEIQDMLYTNLEVLKAKRQELGIKMTEINQQVNNLYHRIETTKFNVCQGYVLADQLRTVLQERRQTKFQIAEADSAICNIKRSINKIKDIKKENEQRLKDYSKEAEEKTKKLLGF